MGRPSIGGLSDRWSGSQSNSTLKSLWLCSNQAFCFESSLNDISPALLFTGLPPPTSVLVSKAVYFWRLGVIGFLTSMVHCMSCNVFGCILWCPSAFTSLLGLESFPFGSNGLFHMLIPSPDFTTPMVGPSCATHLLSCLEQASLDAVPNTLSGSISYTCRCTHMRVGRLGNNCSWGYLSFQT